MRRYFAKRQLNGEVMCPRKGNPLATPIAFVQCKLYHDTEPGKCAHYRCDNYVRAEAGIVELRKNDYNPDTVIGRADEEHPSEEDGERDD